VISGEAGPGVLDIWGHPCRGDPKAPWLLRFMRPVWWL
jgi:hypothetical protein